MLIACAGRNELVGRPDLTVVQNASLPPPQQSDLILQQRSYAVGPLDRVLVEVYGAPDLSRTVQVDASGVIGLPLIGRLQAAGKTPSDLAAMVESRLRGAYVRDPHVTVSVDTNSQTITVDGQVDKPGIYPVLGRMTLMKAVASAQGASENADTNFTVVYRQVGGKQMAALYDLRAIRSGLYADPEIYPNDVVYVGESGGRRAFQLLIQSGALLTAPLVAILNR